MNIPTEVLIAAEIGENATNSHFVSDEYGTNDKEAFRAAFPILILPARVTTEQILKEKGTISVQNMANAVAAARA